MQKYLDMENVPKTFRVNISKEIKFRLFEDIAINKLQLEQMKNNNIENSCIKLAIYQSQLEIYLYNGDLYNSYKKFKKYKKLCFIAIEEFEEKLQDDNNHCITIDSENYTVSKNESAYVNYCNDVKNNLKFFEKVLNILFKQYKLNNGFSIMQ